MRGKLISISRPLVLAFAFSGCATLNEPPNGRLAVNAESQRIAWGIKSLQDPKLRKAALHEIMDWSYESADLRQMPQMDKALAAVFEQDHDPLTRIQIAKAVRKILRDINSKRKDGLNLTINVLVKLISEDMNSQVAMEVVKTLGHYRGSNELVIPALISITLRSNDPKIAWQALHCLVCAGDDKDKNNQALAQIRETHFAAQIRYRADSLLQYHLYYEGLMCRSADSETYIFEKPIY